MNKDPKPETAKRILDRANKMFAGNLPQWLKDTNRAFAYAKSGEMVGTYSGIKKCIKELRKVKNK